MAENILSVVMIVVGIAIICHSVYCKFFKKTVPSPKKWGKTRARVGEAHLYEKRNLSRYNPKDYTCHTENRITYTVNGTLYQKYISEPAGGTVHIYYRLKNPNYFITIGELRGKRREERRTVSFVMMLFIAVILVFLGIAFLFL